MCPAGDPVKGSARTLAPAERAIVGFELDAQGEWVAELECGHRRHVRHDPPLFPQPWVLEAEL